MRHWQFGLQDAFAAIGWAVVTLGIYRLLPIPITNIPLWWLATTVFLAWIGFGIGAGIGKLMRGRPIIRGAIIGGIFGALLGFGFGVLSVQ
jgi:hypothetical protein